MRLVPRQIESYKNDRMIDEVVINELPDVEMIYNIVSEKDKTKTVILKWPNVLFLVILDKIDIVMLK